jgi:hypothetical protein
MSSTVPDPATTRWVPLVSGATSTAVYPEQTALITASAGQSISTGGYITTACNSQDRYVWLRPVRVS